MKTLTAQRHHPTWKETHGHATVANELSCGLIGSARCAANTDLGCNSEALGIGKSPIVVTSFQEAARVVIVPQLGMDVLLAEFTANEGAASCRSLGEWRVRCLVEGHWSAGTFVERISAECLEVMSMMLAITSHCTAHHGVFFGSSR